ncbi:MAG: CHRD domain-containing protein [Cellulomonas sp.]
MTGTRRKILAALAVLVLVGASASAAQGSGDDDDVTRTRLIGYQEVPSISTVGGGTFRARMVSDDAFRFRLTYNRLESPIAQSHIHFAQKGVNGRIVVFLCSNLGNGPAGTAACPGTTSGEVTGTITADDVTGASPPTPDQGISAGEFDELVRAMRAGVAYVNVHTDTFPSGEIRGQLPRRHHH